MDNDDFQTKPIATVPTEDPLEQMHQHLTTLLKSVVEKLDGIEEALAEVEERLREVDGRDGW